MKTTLIITAFSFFVLLSSCNRSGESEAKADTNISTLSKQEGTFQTATKNEKQQQIPVSNQQVTTDSGGIPLPSKPVSNPDWDKKIIKNATLKLEVKDFKNYNDVIHKTVKQFGGYIAQEEQNLSDEKSETVIAIKVPVDQFETMMNQLPAGDIKVIERKINTEDVTGEVIDTKSRLEAKKQMRLKYLEFLKQSKNMEEVLQVQNEVNSIQEEIEAAAGRIVFLSHQSSFSTINLTFFQPQPGYKPSVDETPSFVTRVGNAFTTGANFIAELFIGLIAIWPLLLVSTGLYFGWKRIKNSRKPVINA
jgi:hypothetical protein